MMIPSGGGSRIMCGFDVVCIANNGYTIEERSPCRDNCLFSPET